MRKRGQRKAKLPIPMIDGLAETPNDNPNLDRRNLGEIIQSLEINLAELKGLARVLKRTIEVE